MMTRVALVLSVAAAAMSSAAAFSTTFLGTTHVSVARRTVAPNALSMRVVDIDSPDAFDKTIQSAGPALVVVDYSTTWCGPCKVIAPKFDEFSDKYPDAVFLKVSGCCDASLLLQ